MNTLMIKDLSNTEQLDSKAMSAVRGGNGYCCFPPSYFSYAPVYAPTSIKNVSTTQMINTEMNIQSANGNNSAWVAGTTTTIEPHVTSNNSSYVY
ncbi:hypothetical protein LJ655_12945 [Paraburkholderia sp. MMS20-SJTN17]|uniref:Uncharacterized protein n=1 Tax=Paraburkholderia translucens TaxID=2886945 RepID=A0ABS8KDN3_9BURK|nr:hypothetical protein [Paraburkholderia sp. MMS20-SJTN17]MCC8402782.1 hypothetical protein [Paraburkholderia sp. MMS20-SJTN17]